MEVPNEVYLIQLNDNNIPAMAKILSQDTYVTRNWVELADKLEMQNIHLYQSKLLIDVETHYSVFTILLKHWKGKNNRQNATVGRFLEILLSCSFLNVTDLLIEHFKGVSSNSQVHYSSKYMIELMHKIIMDLFNIRAYFNSRVKAVILQSFYKHFETEIFESHDKFVKGIIKRQADPTEYIELHLTETDQETYRSDLSKPTETKKFIDNMYKASVTAFAEPIEFQAVEDVYHFVNFLKHAPASTERTKEFTILRNLIIIKIIEIKCSSNAYNKHEVDKMKQETAQEVKTHMKP